jgi:hypothetical protein
LEEVEVKIDTMATREDVDWALDSKQVAHATSFSNKKKKNDASEEEDLTLTANSGNDQQQHEARLRQPSEQCRPFVLQPMPPVDALLQQWPQ